MTRPPAPPRLRPPEHSTSSAVPQPSRGTWSRFARRYGWRAYALPLLVVVSVLALFTTTSHHSKAAVGATESTTPNASVSAGPPDAASTGQIKVDNPGAGSVNQVVPTVSLPAGAAYTTKGAGTFATLAGKSAVIGRGQLYKFSIEVENGVTGVDLNAFAVTVMQALSDPKSWTAGGQKALQRVDSGPVAFHITLVSSLTVRTLCGYSLPVESSCFDGGDSRVVLNVARWTRGAKVYAGDLATYRIYAVNHEVGHALGHNHAHNCLADGLAPVMMQQTFGTKTASGAICQANPWPYPKGAADAPGPEQPGDAADLQFYTRNAS